MENILITGGYGFIGLNLLSRLSKTKRYFIHNIDNLSLGHTYYGNFLSKQQKKIIKNYNFNINEKDKVSSLLNKYKIRKCFHLAAESHVDRSITGPVHFFESNVMGTLNLVESCRNYIESTKINDFRFLHVSTDEVFGDLDLNVGYFNEKSPYDPSSPYSASKASSDFILSSWLRTFNFPCIITNCSNNFGSCQNLEKFIPKTISNFYFGKKMPVYGNGRNVRDWLYVDDHVETLVSLMDKGKIGENYVIGGGMEISNIDLLRKIYETMTKFNLNPKLNFENSFEFVKDRKGHDLRYAIDRSKLDKDFPNLKWTNFDNALLKTIQFYALELSNGKSKKI